VAAVLAAAAAGHALGVRAWATYGGFAAATLLAMGWVERLWSRRRLPPPPRIRGKLKVIEGGKSKPSYDLSRDSTTDSQRYLM
jgi:hypothetical protein